MMNNYNIIETYYIKYFKFNNMNKNIIKNGYTIEDLFHNKIIELLEQGYNNPNEEEGIKYINNYFKKRKRNIKEIDVLYPSEETNEDKIKLLFLDYRPSKK